MGFLDDGLRQALEGSFGRRLEEATKATVELKTAFLDAAKDMKRGIAAIERLADVMEEDIKLRKRER